MSLSIQSSRTSISSMNRRGSFQVSPTSIQVASQNQIRTHIQEALTQLQSLKESGLIAKFKILKKNLASKASSESDDAPEEYLPSEAEGDIDDYITGIEYSLLFLNLNLSKNIPARKNYSNHIRSDSVILDDQNINVIEQTKKNIDDLLKEIKQLLANPYKHPSFLEKRWTTAIVAFVAALLNCVLAYLFGAHIIHLSPEVFSMISAILTILPRTIQERVNLHDINGAYKEKEWKENADQLNSLKKSLKSMHKSFQAIHQGINNYYLIEAAQSAVYSTLAENNHRNL